MGTYKRSQDFNGTSVMQKVKKQAAWVEAKKKYGLSRAIVQMAIELGLNPNKLGKIADHKQEAGQEPLPKFTQTLFEKSSKSPRLS